MTSWPEIIAIVVAAALLVPFAVLTLESLAALFPVRRRPQAAVRPRVAVLVPAHDEEAGLPATLSRIQEQLAPGDRLLVVADNCSDRTADVARAAGALVVERHDSTRRGKGFALDFGLQQLAGDPPECVIVIDADTEVKHGAIDALAKAAVTAPAQGLNLLDAPPDAGPGARIAAFAFYFKNAIRPRGMDRLRLPCLLYGTGMAIPWSAIKGVDLAHGDITEDIRLGVELAKLGASPRFCLAAEVRGELPRSTSAAHSQRKRWEHGHLRTLLREVPRLTYFAIRHGRFDLFALALHLGVPPLAFLFLFGGVITVVFWLMNLQLAAGLLAGGMGMTITAILLTWARFGRDRLPARDLVLMPVYMLRKIPLYLRFFIRPQRSWVRTERDH